MESLAPLFGNVAIREFVAEHSFAWPILEILHFVGMALLFGTVMVLDVRLLGVAKRLPVAPLVRFVPLGIAGFVLAAVTGYCFITSSPGGPLDYLNNFTFQMKTACLLLAGANVLTFYVTGTARAADRLGPGEDAPRGAKIIAGFSLALWIAVIYFGRMLMYNDAFYTSEFYPF